MNNLEKMKQYLISEINKMDAEEFEKVNYIILEEMEFLNKASVNTELFSCNKCRKIYGKCQSNDINITNICSERFVAYALNEVQ